MSFKIKNFIVELTVIFFFEGIVNLSFPQDLKATFDLRASSIVSTDVEVDSDGTKNTHNNELLGKYCFIFQPNMIPYIIMYVLA